MLCKRLSQLHCWGIVKESLPVNLRIATHWRYVGKCHKAVFTFLNLKYHCEDRYLLCTAWCGARAVANGITLPILINI